MDKAALKKTQALLKPGIKPLDVSEHEGFLDLLGDGAEPAQQSGKLFLLDPISAVYERWWRPCMGRMAKGMLGPSMSDEREIARLLLALSLGDKVLDLACGTGGFTRDFAEVVGPQGLVVGADSSRAMLERAIARARPDGLENIAFVRVGADRLPFHDASFNAVCCFAALHLFPLPYAALDQMRAVLAPGGRIALFTTVRGRTRALRRAEDLVARSSGMYMFEEDEVREALKTRNFTEIRQRVSGFTQFIGGRLPE